jgi:protein-S-isoprenylcysteine O-methyltransferase Ste14
MHRRLGWVLVLVQFGCLIYFGISGPWLAHHPVWLLLEIVALLLAGWAIATMRLSQLNILPAVRDQARLVEDGPYRWVRHPMYSALLLLTLALLFDAPTPDRWGVWLVLLVNLLVKLHYEEQLLTAAFPAYASYRTRTKRLLPGIY